MGFTDPEGSLEPAEEHSVYWRLPLAVGQRGTGGSWIDTDRHTHKPQQCLTNANIVCDCIDNNGVYNFTYKTQGKQVQERHERLTHARKHVRAYSLTCTCVHLNTYVHTQRE